MIVYDYLWLFMINYDDLWLFMIIYDYLWLFMIMYDYVWLFMIIYDYLCIFHASMGISWDLLPKSGATLWTHLDLVCWYHHPISKAWQ